MRNIVSYINILENADRILKGFGPDPDRTAPGYINAYTIYETAFAELMQSGIGYLARDGIVVIETDGKEYRYLYDENESAAGTGTGVFDMIHSEENVLQPFVPAEDEAVELPPELDEDEMEGEEEAPPAPERTSEAEEDPDGAEDARDYDQEEESIRDILDRQEHEGTEEEPPQTAALEEEELHRQDDPAGSIEDISWTEEEEPSLVLGEEDGYTDAFKESPAGKEEESVIAPGKEDDNDILLGEEDEDADVFGEDPSKEEDDKAFILGEEDDAALVLGEEDDVSQDEDTKRQNNEPDVLEDPSQPEFQMEEPEPGFTEPDLPEDDIVPPDEEDYGLIDMSEPTPEEEDHDGIDDFGGAEAEESRQERIPEKIETEQDESPRERLEMPDTMHENDFTMSRHQIIILKDGKELGRTIVFTAPMSIDGPDTRILAGILTNGKIAVYITSKGKSSTVVKSRWIPIIITGRMEDGEYTASCTLSDDYKEMGYSIIDQAVHFGKRGHVVMDDDEGNLHIHILPVSSKNLPSGITHCFYCIEYNGKVQVGSSLESRESDGHVRFRVNGCNYDMVTLWENERFMCHIIEI